MTKEFEMGQRPQKGVEENSRSKSKNKSSIEKISSSEIESSEGISSAAVSIGGKKIESNRTPQRNNGSPELGGGKRQSGGGGRGKFGHGEESSRSLNGHQQPAQQNNRSRCRCWCCCCTCACLALQRNEVPEQPNSDPICDGDAVPSLEEIRSWGESFDKLMRSPSGRKVFRDFLKCEYSEENILFWLACEELKNESRPETIEEKARLIYEDYISILSPKEVSLDSRVREIVNQNMVDPNPHTFDEAQMQIYTLMHRDSYPRFVNSSMYKKLAQLNPVNNTQSSPSPTTGTDQHRGSTVSNTASRKQSIAT